MEIALIFWIALSCAVGVLASGYGRSFVGWAFLAVVVSPLIAGVLLIALGRTLAKDADRMRAVLDMAEGKPVTTRKAKLPAHMAARIAAENAARQGQALH